MLYNMFRTSRDKKRAAQEAHQWEILRQFQHATEINDRAVAVLAEAKAAEKDSSEALHVAKLALRRVADGGI